MGWNIWGTGLTMVAILILLALRDHIGSRGPILTARGTLVGRTVRASHVATGLQNRERQLYQLTFRLEGGDALTLYVPEQAYVTLTEGTDVKLIWQKERLLRYELEAQTH